LRTGTSGARRARAGHGGKKQALAAEEARLDATDPLDVVAHGLVERDEAARVHAQPLTGGERHLDDRPAAVDERLPAAFELLEDKPFPAEETGANPSREGDADLNLADRAEKRRPSGTAAPGRRP
jgi:hypothetical protein